MKKTRFTEEQMDTILREIKLLSPAALASGCDRHPERISYARFSRRQSTCLPFLSSFRRLMGLLFALDRHVRMWCGPGRLDTE